MCAIAGFVGFEKEGLLKQMSADLAHRGPDGEGIFHQKNISLLNRRLAIIDRKGGDQPIYNEDKSLVVVYNGEIYNYRTLRGLLEKKGHTFTTKTDTEIIVHGYEEWGTDCFDKFNGMFAIALYDTEKKRLILARDHFGIKPLYYTVGTAHAPSVQILFSSEITPLLHSGLVAKKVNERILYRYLKYRIHDDGRETFFAGIQRLLPGELMIVEGGHREIIKYTQLELELMRPVQTRPLRKTDIEMFQNKLDAAVRMRLVSEVPVGTALSGGLDSSTIVALVNRTLQEHAKEAHAVGDKQNTFSALFPGAINDEERYINVLLNQFEKIQSHKVFPTSSVFFTDLPEFIRTQEEPTISSGPYAQFQVMRAAQKHVTVLLDGQGADEILAGYQPYYFVYLRELSRTGRYFRLLKEAWDARDIVWHFIRLKIEQVVSGLHIVDMNSLLHEKYKETYQDETFEIVYDDLKKRLANDIFRDSLQSLLRYEDRNTMHFSLEGRVPFLDKELLTYLFSLPDEAIIKNGWSKYILRKSVRDFLPKAIWRRRAKIGFTTPEHDWFMQSKKEVYEIFLSESFASRPYWSQEKVLKSYRLFLQGKHDDTMVFWRLMNVEMWLREFFDGVKSEKFEAKRTKQRQKTIGEANEGKKIEIEVGGTTYRRYPIRTERFEKGDDYAGKIAQFVSNIGSQLTSQSIDNTPLKLPPRGRNKKGGVHNWYAIVSEKIVAISQGRAYFIWDINPTWWAQILSKFVRRTPYGIGLGSPWTMQLAIQEVGLSRIMLAAFVSVITKPLGIKGLFYRIAGRGAAGIDGPTEYSLYPSNVSAKLIPKDPQRAAEKIKQAIEHQLSSRANRSYSSTFAGAVIIDANDIGRNILGNATDKPDAFFEKVMRDNPMGQGSEQTPVVIVT